MSCTRLLYVALSLAIGDYLYESATFKNIETNPKCQPSSNTLAGCLCRFTADKYKRWNRFVKVKAQPIDDNSDDNGDDEERKADVGDEVSAAHVIPLMTHNGITNVKSPYFAYVMPDEWIPTRSIVMYRDYFVFVDSRTKTPIWSVQRISRRNWARTEHRHCELVTFEYEMPEDFEAGRETNNERVELVTLLAKTSIRVDGQVFCLICLQSKFWKRFHEYISHLLDIYEEVDVCSGVLHLTDVPMENPDHVFKVICCKNPGESTYRFECYKIPTEPMLCVPKLNDYLITREELETRTGIKVFEHVRNCKIKQTETHPDFI